MCLVAVVIACLIHKFFLENQSLKKNFITRWFYFYRRQYFFYARRLIKVQTNIFSASEKQIIEPETLKKNVELKNIVLRTNWFSEGGKYTIFEKPIRGDFLGRVMLTSLNDSKTCSSLAEQEKYLKQVNQELKTAFENGTLEKNDKIQISL